MPGSYLNVLECPSCHQACLTCTGAGDNSCTECSNGYNLEGGICTKPDCGYLVFQEGVGCVNGCILGNYPFEDECHLCRPDCLKCNTYEVCIECASLFNSAGDCIDSCPANTYSNGTHCLECAEGCINCLGDTVKDCEACDEANGFFQTDEGCVQL